jgi:hypothetical protein
MLKRKCLIHSRVLIRSLTYTAVLEIVDGSRGVTLTPSATVISGPYPNKRSFQLEKLSFPRFGILVCSLR